jgi:predicted acyl esterase
MRPPPLSLREGGPASFAAPTGEKMPDTYVYDPADVAGETVGRSCWALCTTLDDRRRLDDRADILRYVSDPLDRDLELTGPITVEIHAAASAVDTDFVVTRCHVLADGTVNTTQDGIIRACHRNGAGDAPDLEPGAVEHFGVGMSATSYLGPADGSRQPDRGRGAGGPPLRRLAIARRPAGHPRRALTRAMPRAAGRQAVRGLRWRTPGRRAKSPSI